MTEPFRNAILSLLAAGGDLVPDVQCSDIIGNPNTAVNPGKTDRSEWEIAPYSSENAKNTVS